MAAAGAVKAGAMAVLALGLLALGGCAGATPPIDSRALVLAVAADPAGPGQIKYTLAIPSPQSLSGSSGGGNEFYYPSTAAASFDGAISRLEDQTSRDVYLGQMHLLMLSLQLPPLLRDRLIAEEQRIGEVDHTEWLALADGPAARVMQPPPLQERLPAFYFSTHFSCRTCQSADYGVPAWRAEADLASAGSVAVLPVARLDGANIAIDRVAALQRGKPPFIFNPEETLAVMALRGRLSKGSLEVSTPLGPAVLRSLAATARRSAAVGADGRLHVRVRVSYKGLLAQRPERVQHMTAAAARTVEGASAQALTRLLTAAIARAQAAGVDAFYFGQALYLQDPERYRALGDFSRALQHAVVAVEVKVSLPEQGITA